jgi:hypothetical protein
MEDVVFHRDHRADGSRPALHMAGATGNFFVPTPCCRKSQGAKVFHAGGVGLMHAMDTGRTAEVMKAAKAAGALTTTDIFAVSADDMPARQHPSVHRLFPAIDRGSSAPSPA